MSDDREEVQQAIDYLVLITTKGYADIIGATLRQRGHRIPPEDLLAAGEAVARLSARSAVGAKEYLRTECRAVSAELEREQDVKDEARRKARRKKK